MKQTFCWKWFTKKKSIRQIEEHEKFVWSRFDVNMQRRAFSVSSLFNLLSSRRGGVSRRSRTQMAQQSSTFINLTPSCAKISYQIAKNRRLTRNDISFWFMRSYIRRCYAEKWNLIKFHSDSKVAIYFESLEEFLIFAKLIFASCVNIQEIWKYKNICLKISFLEILNEVIRYKGWTWNSTNSLCNREIANNSHKVNNFYATLMKYHLSICSLSHHLPSPNHLAYLFFSFSLRLWKPLFSTTVFHKRVYCSFFSVWLSSTASFWDDYRV